MTKKPFKSIEEQIEILKNRNLIIENEKLAKEFLLYENYYKVINGYKEIFINKKKSEEEFENGLFFEDIKNLYLFDKDLKILFLKKILVIEANLRSIISYYFSEEHQEKFNYLNVDNYSINNSVEYKKVLKNIGYIVNIIYNNIDKEGSIKHYINKYNDIPLWVLVNYFTLGNLTFFYSVLSNKVKNNITKEINKDGITTNYINELLSLINILRNICAHQEILFNYKIKINKKIKDE